jgi:hypothetical protein
MKILVNSTQFRLLLETNGIDDFMDIFVNSYPKFEIIADDVREFIINSKCQNIEISNIAFSGAAGFALYDRVVLNKMLFNDVNNEYKLSYLLYAIFHELSHSYQYKKYGFDKMISFYTNEISISEAAEFMQYIENVADEFAIRKLRQIALKYKGEIDINYNIIKKAYKDVPIIHYIQFIKQIKNIIEKSGVKDKRQIPQLMYNYLKYMIIDVNSQKKK